MCVDCDMSRICTAHHTSHDHVVLVNDTKIVIYTINCPKILRLLNLPYNYIYVYTNNTCINKKRHIFVTLHVNKLAITKSEQKTYCKVEN